MICYYNNLKYQHMEDLKLSKEKHLQIAKGFFVPVKADRFLGPEVYYSDTMIAICFVTNDSQYGRITFEDIDSIKVSSGEILPFQLDWKIGTPYNWISKVENSVWLKERYKYEIERYKNNYEYSRNGNEMLTDYKHYVFSFYNEFIEVISRGFWFEKDDATLFGKPLQPGHPFLPLSEINAETIVAHNLTCQVRTNRKPKEEIILSTKYCTQKLMEFAVELDGEAKVDNTLSLFCRNGKLLSRLRGFFSRREVVFEGIATLGDVKPYIEKYMGEVYNRRKV